MSETTDKLPITAAVLAGGRSLRMGVDKTLLDVDGRPLVARVVGAVGEVCEQTLVVTNRPEALADAGLPGEVRVVQDEVAYQGPLGGLERARERVDARGGGRYAARECGGRRRAALRGGRAPAAHTARNQLPVTVASLTGRGSANHAVLDAGGMTLAASVSRAATADLSLAPGTVALAVFKATAVRWRLLGAEDGTTTERAGGE